MIGTYIKCENQQHHCRNTEQVPPGSTASSLPTGWALVCVAPEPLEDPRLMHFCSTQCAYLHDSRITREETALVALEYLAANPIEHVEEEASA